MANKRERKVIHHVAQVVSGLIGTVARIARTAGGVVQKGLGERTVQAPLDVGPLLHDAVTLLNAGLSERAGSAVRHDDERAKRGASRQGRAASDAALTGLHRSEVLTARRGADAKRILNLSLLGRHRGASTGDLMAPGWLAHGTRAVLSGRAWAGTTRRSARPGFDAQDRGIDVRCRSLLANEPQPRRGEQHW